MESFPSISPYRLLYKNTSQTFNLFKECTRAEIKTSRAPTRQMNLFPFCTSDAVVGAIKPTPVDCMALRTRGRSLLLQYHHPAR